MSGPVIIGAGMAGLIAAHVFRASRPKVIEAQPSLPDNHSALLRFRSPLVAEVTGVPMRRVRVTKGVLNEFGEVRTEASLRDCNAYSMRVAGRLENRSIGALAPEDRWIAPPGFVEMMADGIGPVSFGYRITPEDAVSIARERPVISTLPISFFQQSVTVQLNNEFPSRPIWTINADIVGPACDVHQTLYIPHAIIAGFTPYRASIVGGRFILEGVGAAPKSLDNQTHIAYKVLELMTSARPDEFVLDEVRMREQRLGKIMRARDESARRDLIARLTRERNIYSLGRFAVWRPLLLEDVVRDAEVIRAMIHGGAYTADLAATKRS